MISAITEHGKGKPGLAGKNWTGRPLAGRPRPHPEASPAPNHGKTTHQDRGRPPVVEARLVSNVVMQLNLVRKNAVLYPEGHPQLRSAMARVLQALDRCFYESQGEELEFHVTRGVLYSGETALSGANPAHGEFAAFLHDLSVLSLTLKRGVSRDEITAAGRIFAEERTPWLKRPDLAKALKDAGVFRIVVTQIDYESLAFTEDGTRPEERDGGQAPAGPGTWQEVVQNILQGKADLAEGVSLTGAAPGEIAAWINRLEQSGVKDLAHNKAAAHFLAEIAAREQGDDSSSGAQIKKNFVSIIEALDMAPRQAFLEETFQLADRTPHIAAEILRQIPPPILLRAIEKARESGAAVNPAILALVHRLTQAGQPPPAPQLVQEAKKTEKAQAGECDGLGAEGFLSLMRSVRSQAPIASALLDSLQALTREQVDKAPGDSFEVFPGEMDPLRISGRFARVNLDLFERAEDGEEALDHARILAGIVAENMTLGKWGVLREVLEGLEQAALDHEYDKPFLIPAFRETVDQLWDVENIAMAAAALLQHGTEHAQDVADMTARSGPEAGRRMVQALIQEDNKSVRGVLLKLICLKPRITLPVVREHLHDSRWFVVRNMLTITKTVLDREAVDRVEELALDKHPRVRVEALRALARIGSPRAPQLILEAMHDENHEVSLSGISVAGLIFDSRVTRALVDIVKDNRSKGEEALTRRLRAVKALAEIRDPGVLTDLHDAAAARTLFAGAGFDRVKLEIYRSLKHYPLKHLSVFAADGLKDPDVRIVEYARRLKARMEASQGGL